MAACCRVIIYSDAPSRPTTRFNRLNDGQSATLNAVPRARARWSQHNPFEVALRFLLLTQDGSFLATAGLIDSIPKIVLNLQPALRIDGRTSASDEPRNVKKANSCRSVAAKRFSVGFREAASIVQ